MQNKILTLIIPAYNEEDTLKTFYEETNRVERLISKVKFEYLFIDDGSKDKTLEILRDLSKKIDNVNYISFSRNFGKEAAIYAGLKNANGDYVAILDADLQDPPSLLLDMLSCVEKEGYDCVGSRRITRTGEPPIRSFFSKTFYKLINKISKIEIVDGARDFQLMSRKVVNAILEIGEYNRFSKGIFGWIGFNKKWIEYENIERLSGKTKWSFISLFLYALDGIIAFSTVPLIISSLLGILFCFLSLAIIIFIIIRTLLFGDPTSGWPSLACLVMFVSGIQLFCMGIIGQYLSKTYLETKKRPIYLISEISFKNT